MAERSSEDFAFLPVLVDRARDNGGLTLPTVGSAGLRETARLIFAGSHDLSMVGQLPTEVTEVPETIHFVSYQEEPQSETPAAPAPAAEAPAAEAPAAEAPAAGGETSDLLSELDPTSKLIDEVERDRAVIVGKIQAEVEQGLNLARKTMGTNSEAAIQSLKNVLDNVQRSPDLNPEIRAQLRDRLVSAIREAGRQQVQHDETRRQAEANRAIVDEAQRLAHDFTDKRERVKQLMTKFDALIDEGISLALSGENVEAEQNFDNAIDDIANPIENSLPGEPIGISARMNASIMRQLTGIIKFRQLRQRGLVDALYEVERASIPVADEPPIKYPDSEFWERISTDRKKYKAMDLLGGGTPERKIYDALDRETMLEFNEAPLSEVVDYLKTANNIPIMIDKKALDDVGLGSDTPVTISLPGVTLRSALKLMLKELDLTYVIRDEVLKITTPEEAENELLTKVYPVADLVLPITGGMGGGMMGGMGGGMGGMGGGMGGMGGGMGGGMMGGMGGGMGGMGGMGGFFDVEEDLTLGVKSASSSPTAEPAQAPAALSGTARVVPTQPVEPIVVTPSGDQSPDDAWDNFFAQHQGDSAESAQLLDLRIRATAREFSSREKYADIVPMISAAIRSSQGQPWMYEALALAMLAADCPRSDVERALMSAVDLSSEMDTMMDIAIYMARVGLDQRALQLLREVAFANPFRPEPYALGLASAKRLDDIDGIRWATLGILSQAWPEEQSGVEDRALRLAKATVDRLRQSGRSEDADAYEKAIEDARLRDVTATVSWTGDADVDVIVQEPAGTVCSLQNSRTTAGGVMLGDAYGTGSGSSGYTETYVCPMGFTGQYRMLVQRVWGTVTAGKVTVDIRTTNPDRPHIHTQIELGEKDALVLFDVTNGRRAEHLAQQQLANLQTPQVDVDRSLVTRQLNRYEGSLASQEFNRDRAKQRGWRGAGPVGFQPDITVLPTGAMMMANPGSALAVVSADRRYVRVSPYPFFSQVGNVTTFNFGTGATTTLPDDDDDDDATN